MITGFKTKPQVPARTFKQPRMNYVRERLQSNYQKFKTYYRFNDFAVRSDHILVTLINSLPHLPTMPKERAYEVITQAAYSVGNGLNIGSVNYPAKIQQRNCFYGHSTNEILYICPKAPFSFEYPQNWKDAEALKVITHPKSDLTFRLLDGKETSYESGYAVIEIDPGLLMWQYRHFLAEQSLRPAGERLGVQHFVVKYPLANMLGSHLDVAFINRHIRYNNGQMCGENERRQPFALPDNYTNVDTVVHATVETLAQQPLTILQILDNIELPFSEDVLSFMQEPDNYVDVRNVKAYRIARALPVIQLALSLRFQAVESPDPLQNELMRVWKSVKNERVIDGIKYGEFLFDLFESEIVPYITA